MQDEPRMFIKDFPKSLLDKCPSDQRMGQWIINNRHKTMSMMFNEEVEWRRKLWYVSNQDFWKEFAAIVDVTK